MHANPYIVGNRHRMPCAVPIAARRLQGVKHEFDDLAFGHLPRFAHFPLPLELELGLKMQHLALETLAHTRRACPRSQRQSQRFPPAQLSSTASSPQPTN